MKHATIFLLVFFVVQSHAQVVDVNDDGVVGAHEALAVAEEWKQEARAADDHNHLGQTWIGDRNPLKIRGNYPPRFIFVSGDDREKASISIPSAPLILDNTSTHGSGMDPIDRHPDLLLGRNGIIQSEEHLELYSGLSMVLTAPGGITLYFGQENWGRIMFASAVGHVADFDREGNLNVEGTCACQNGKYETDHPLDPKGKTLSHSNVGSPEMKNVYDGVVVLDEEGEAVVELPEYFEAFNSDFRYQLTCVGEFAPVYVAEKIDDNRFRIAGGNPDQEISWQVTGVRRDAYAKANPVRVEREKPTEEKGKHLHPELFGESVEKNVGRSRDSGE